MREIEEILRIRDEKLSELGPVEKGDERWVCFAPDGVIRCIADNMEDAHERVSNTSALSLPLFDAIEKKLTWDKSVKI